MSSWNPWEDDDLHVCPAPPARAGTRRREPLCHVGRGAQPQRQEGAWGVGCGASPQGQGRRCAEPGRSPQGVGNAQHGQRGAGRARLALTLVTVSPTVPRGHPDLTAPSFPPSHSTVHVQRKRSLLAAGTTGRVTGQQDGAELSGGGGLEAQDTMGGRRPQKPQSWHEWPHLGSLTPPARGPRSPSLRPRASGPWAETLRLPGRHPEEACLGAWNLLEHPLPEELSIPHAVPEAAPPAPGPGSLCSCPRPRSNTPTPLEPPELPPPRNRAPETRIM